MPRLTVASARDLTLDKILEGTVIVLVNPKKPWLFLWIFSAQAESARHVHAKTPDAIRSIDHGAFFQEALPRIPRVV
jgi:hypothetical protein